MTNDKEMTNDEARINPADLDSCHLGFVIHSSFVIRHLEFPGDFPEKALSLRVDRLVSRERP
jgi:hypothetical protein